MAQMGTEGTSLLVASVETVSALNGHGGLDTGPAQPTFCPEKPREKAVHLGGQSGDVGMCRRRWSPPEALVAGQAWAEDSSSGKMELAESRSSPDR